MMNQIQNSAGTLFLKFNPAVGGSITRFFVVRDGKEIDLMRPAPVSGNYTVLDVSSFPLTPYSNRIDHGKFAFGGREYKVGPNFREEPHPNHGTGWTSQWSVEKQESDEVTLTLSRNDNPHSPYVYYARQTFKLSNTGLSISMSIRNDGPEALPFGLGHHPYFRKTPETRLMANIQRVWESNAMIPTQLVDVPEAWDFSKGRNLSSEIGAPVNGFGGNDYIDGCFVDWDGNAEIEWPEDHAKLQIQADDLFRHFVIYVPQGNFFCAEPVSHATDAFNLADKGHKDVGLTILQPNQAMSGIMNFNFVG